MTTDTIRLELTEREFELIQNAIAQNYRVSHEIGAATEREFADLLIVLRNAKEQVVQS